ncbi:hypothetical protein GCM10027160_21870 [Streptomyces calidiresistens]
MSRNSRAGEKSGHTPRTAARARRMGSPRSPDASGAPANGTDRRGPPRRGRRPGEPIGPGNAAARPDGPVGADSRRGKTGAGVEYMSERGPFPSGWWTRPPAPDTTDVLG